MEVSSFSRTVRRQTSRRYSLIAAIVRDHELIRPRQLPQRQTPATEVAGDGSKYHKVLAVPALIIAARES
jgi:hypothetical protein